MPLLVGLACKSSCRLSRRPEPLSILGLARKRSNLCGKHKSPSCPPVIVVDLKIGGLKLSKKTCLLVKIQPVKTAPDKNLRFVQPVQDPKMNGCQMSCGLLENWSSCVKLVKPKKYFGRSIACLPAGDFTTCRHCCLRVWALRRKGIGSTKAQYIFHCSRVVRQPNRITSSPATDDENRNKS